MNGHSRNLFSNNNSSFNFTTNNYTTVSDETSLDLSWISPLESWKRHSDIVRARAEGIGEWVLRSSEFQEWRKGGNDLSANRILFCHGAPGAGKTFICSLVIDTLCDEAAGSSVAVGFLYCDYREQKEQTAEAMIGSLLRQFVTGLPEIPEAIIEDFEDAKCGLRGRAPELAKIVELFPAVLEHFQRVFICIDALDEFVAEYRPLFLHFLGQILEKSPNTKTILTARHHIQSDLERNIPLYLSTITIQPLFSDIEKYLVKKLDTDPHPGAMDDRLRSEIMTKILSESSEIFLVVALQIDLILGEITLGGRRKKLREMTNGLSDAYTDTLQRINGQPRAVATCGISALMWISLSERALLFDELCHALATEPGSQNFDTEMVPPIETVVASCMGLVTADHASPTVRLVHATLGEYLRGQRGSIFKKPHATIAKVCLRYLGIQAVRELPSHLKSAPPAFLLLGYASCHWGTHARKELTTGVRRLALETLNQYPQHAAANILLSNRWASWSWRCSSEGFSGLHCVAYFGIDGLLEELLRMENANLNRTDQWGRTPLILAAGRGHERVLMILLSSADVDPNLMDGDRQTPLFQASASGHEGVVRIILRRTDVDPNSADLYGQTPLFQASTNGHAEVVRILLSRKDSNPNLANWLGQTPLFLASGNGHEGVVRALLRRIDVKPNLANRTDETPLFLACSNGSQCVVEVILGRPDVNPNSPDLFGQTPLSQASANGHEAAVGILVRRADVEPNLVDGSGRTPLLRASENGHAGVVRILASYTNVDPNLGNWIGQTPLFLASLKGHVEVVVSLLTRADINPDSANRHGQTPLFRASANGHEAVVKTLLSRADVNPTLVDHYGQTPLFIATCYGHGGIVRLLQPIR